MGGGSLDVAEDPGGGNDVVNAQSVPRVYEQKSRALLTAPFLGKLKDDDLQGLEPHARIYPTGFHQPKGEFKDTLLSSIDLVYCGGADKAKPYNKWRGTHFIATRRRWCFTRPSWRTTRRRS